MKGDILDLEIYVPSAKEPIHMEGVVRWCNRCIKGKKYNTGVKLTSVEGNPVDKSIILDSIHNVAWSIVLESVFGSFKHLMLKQKKIQVSSLK